MAVGPVKNRRLFPALAAALLLAPVAGADLVIMPEGGFLQVAAYEVDADRVRLTLPNGGRLVMALARVERIIADEIVEAAAEEAAPPVFSLRFDSSHPRPETPYGELIYDAAERHALNPALVAAVARAESAFDPRAVSVKGAQGLMQLMPATARRFGLAGESVYEPARNIDAGARYLRWLADRFDDDLSRVLAAYNAGEGTVERYGGVPPYRETHGYLRRIYATLHLAVDDVASGVVAAAAVAGR